MKKKSLSSQLLFTTGIIYLFGIIIFGWVVAYIYTDKLFHNEVKDIKSLIGTISTSLRHSIAIRDISTVETVLEEYLKDETIIRITVVNPDNIIISQLTSFNKGIKNTYNYGEEFIGEQLDNGHKVTLSKEILRSGNIIGKIYADVSLNELYSIRYEIWLTITAAGSLIFLIVFIVMTMQLKLLLEPLYKTTNFTHNFLNNLGKTIHAETNVEEINDLIQAVNWSSVKLKQQEGFMQETADLLELKVKKRTRELELAKQQAEAASEEKSRFLSDMSHELRTPLNSILGFSQILMLKPKSMTEDQISSIEEINKSGTHLLSLVNEVLDISKIEEGELAIELAPVNIDSFFTEFMKSVLDLAEHKHIALNLSNQIPVDQLVLADITRLTQVMYNLISNAIKYTHEEGKIQIKLLEHNKKIEVQVIDNGIGIHEDDYNKIFNKFTRLTNNHAVEGAGIGLHLTKQIVQLMNGEIGFTSEYGSGSCFWFRLDRFE